MMIGTVALFGAILVLVIGAILAASGHKVVWEPSPIRRGNYIVQRRLKPDAAVLVGAFYGSGGIAAVVWVIRGIGFLGRKNESQSG